jgi:hypothetical protein
MPARKEKEMTNPQANLQPGRTEESFIGELETKSTEELRRFLAGSWTASILSPEAIEELYQYQEHRQKEETPQQEYEYRGSRHFPF